MFKINNYKYILGNVCLKAYAIVKQMQTYHSVLHVLKNVFRNRVFHCIVFFQL